MIDFFNIVAFDKAYYKGEDGKIFAICGITPYEAIDRGALLGQRVEIVLTSGEVFLTSKVEAVSRFGNPRGDLLVISTRNTNYVITLYND